MILMEHGAEVDRQGTIEMIVVETIVVETIVARIRGAKARPTTIGRHGGIERTETKSVILARKDLGETLIKIKIVATATHRPVTSAIVMSVVRHPHVEATVENGAGMITGPNVTTDPQQRTNGEAKTREDHPPVQGTEKTTKNELGLESTRMTTVGRL